ncbi:hypothetical protein [Methylocystis sp. IM3]
MTPTMTSSAPRAAEILPAYANMIHLVERLHRRLMDVVTDALDRANIKDVSAVQAIMLYNIADQELTVSELRERDYYTGSNSSYNVKKLATEISPLEGRRNLDCLFSHYDTDLL